MKHQPAVGTLLWILFSLLHGTAACHRGPYAQCELEINSCFCVDPGTGLEIQGTRRSLVLGPPSCKDVQQRDVRMTTASRVRSAQTTSSKITYPFLPAPEDVAIASTFRAATSIGSTLEIPSDKTEWNGHSNSRRRGTRCNDNVCWCVDPETEREIPGTRTGPQPPNCRVRQTRRKTGHTIPGINPVAPVFQSFRRKPAPGRTPDISPVHRHSAESPRLRPLNSRSEPGKQIIEHSTLDSTVIRPSCTAQRQKFMGDGAYVPHCESDGAFSRIQCYEPSGQCWCVDPQTGVEIAGTRHQTRHRDATVCTSQRSKAESSDFNQQHSSSLKPDGKFTVAKQKHAVVIGTCLHQRMQMMRNAVSASAYIPSCSTDGSGEYQPTQCHTAIGECWCVNTISGQEIAGTRTRYQRPHCASLNADAAYKLLGSTLLDTQELEPRGVTNTVLRATLLDKNVANNGLPGACALQAASLTNIVGAFVPSCTKDGNFSPIQCHAPLYACWCVNSITGIEILGTRLTLNDYDDSTTLLRCDT